MDEYVTKRVSEIMDEAKNAKTEEEKAWLYRVAQEISWARDYTQGTTKAGCFLQYGI